MDGSHQQVHQRFVGKERQEALQRTRGRLGAGLRGRRLHGVHQVPIQRSQQKSKSHNFHLEYQLGRGCTAQVSLIVLHSAGKK